MNEIKFVKADGSETTIDSTIADFKASVKFTTDDLTIKRGSPMLLCFTIIIVNLQL